MKVTIKEAAELLQRLKIGKRIYFLSADSVALTTPECPHCGVVQQHGRYYTLYVDWEKLQTIIITRNSDMVDVELFAEHDSPIYGEDASYPANWGLQSFHTTKKAAEQAAAAFNKKSKERAEAKLKGKAKT
ncbi:MAG: hypothetical protein U9Q38_01430 [Thermodesulfobacteriota bacterium]|nr:hypothetical protein [Thermodesulfobacteriota bacterium]